MLLSVTILAPAWVCAQDRPPAAVIVDVVQTRDVVRELLIVGEVRPRRSSVVASETDGKVVARPKDVGDYVDRGDVLMRLSNDQLLASLAEARADVELQDYNFERASELLETDAISEQDLRSSRYQQTRARSKLRDLESRVRNLEIRAPYRGHIVSVMSEIGEWVTRGEGVVGLISTDTIRVHVNVQEAHVPSLEPGDSAAILIDAIGTESIPGEIVAVLAEGLAESHTFPVLVEAPNPGHRIRSNMAARVKLRIERPDAPLLVHKDAVVTSPQGAVVFLVVDGQASSRSVRTGLAYQEYVAVTGDLNPGDLVIVRGNERLRDGQQVNVLRKLE